MWLRLAAIAIPLFPLAGGAQVPPGHRFDPGLHPNPIVTFVENADFRPVSYDEAREDSGIELLGLSGLDASLDAIAIAAGRTLEVRVIGRRTEVLAFPVVRQVFRFAGGGTLTLYSFRDPRTDLPSSDAEAMLNAEALTPPRRPGEGRFGPAGLPDSLSVRGRPGLLFESPTHRSLFWQEDGAGHVAVSDMDTDELFRVVDDLL
jgi:hypothetical protein